MHKSILVIDDDRDIAEAIKRTVESNNENWQCEIANEPYEAMLAMADRRFDFILIDQKIPGLRGTSILRRMDQYIDSDPLLNDSPTYIKPLPVAIMSGDYQPALDDLHLKYFKMINFVEKRNLGTYLSQTFAS